MVAPTAGLEGSVFGIAWISASAAGAVELCRHHRRDARGRR